MSKTLEDFMPEPKRLKQIIEVGRVIVADFADSICMFKDTTPALVQEQGVLPFAIFGANKEAWNLAMLTAFVIAEGFPTGEIILPDYFTEDLQFGSDIGHEDGNTGNISDDVKIRLVGKDGHFL